MNDTEQLITLTVELEGLLRVVRDRNDDVALSLARGKAAAIAAALATAESAPDTIAVPADEPDKPAEPSETTAEPAEAPDVSGPEAPAPGSDVASTPAPTPAAPRDLRRYLTLNDKFRFRRELFGGSDEELNDTLDLISSMRSIEEVDEYLFDDLAWDSGNAVVKEFRSIVAGAFNQR